MVYEVQLSSSKPQDLFEWTGNGPVIWMAHGGHGDYNSRLWRMPRTNLNLFEECELLEINILR